jgi:hypothetical protein
MFRLGRAQSRPRPAPRSQLGGVRQLEPVRSEELDPVVLVRVVGGRDHHPHIRPHRPREKAHRRRRHRDPAAARSSPSRSAPPSARFPAYSPTAACPCRSPPDVAERQPSRRKYRPAAAPSFSAISAVIGQWVRPPTDAIGAEKLAVHVSSSLGIVDCIACQQPAPARVSATSCTRVICTPCATPASATASDPGAPCGCRLGPP